MIVDLPLPPIHEIVTSSSVPYSQTPPTTCWAYAAKPFAFVTGFTADGQFITGSANNQAACGHAGRGGGMTYYHYCASFLWDLSGNLVQTTVGTCPGSAGGSYTEGSYSAYTVIATTYGYLEAEYPVLVTP